MATKTTPKFKLPEKKDVKEEIKAAAPVEETKAVKEFVVKDERNLDTPDDVKDYTFFSIHKNLITRGMRFMNGRYRTSNPRELKFLRSNYARRELDIIEQSDC